VKVLVINAGSSSLKFQMYRMGAERMLAKGIVERIGLDKPLFKYEREDGVKQAGDALVANHDDALRLVCGKLVHPETGVVQNLSEVQAIGHRVVHGGEKMTDSVKITAEIKTAIRDCFSLAPLHNPPNLGAIEACERVFPGTPNVAVFDTAFHQTMAPEAYLYAIPYELYQKYGIRRYGFHGTSHKFVTQAAADYLGQPAAKIKLITCHLGNGSSVAAVKHGHVIDTSMGMTPLPGLIMGTRSGDLDPAVVLHLVKMGMSADQVDGLLNKKSGLLAMAGTGTGDMRDLVNAVANGSAQAKQALDMFVHRLVFYIGAYFALLDGADAIVFTGGIGENSIPARKAVIERLAGLGCIFNPAGNAVMGQAATLTTPKSKVKAIVIPTNEELMIARETVRVLEG